MTRRDLRPSSPSSVYMVRATNQYLALVTSTRQSVLNPDIHAHIKGGMSMICFKLCQMVWN